MLRYLIVPVVAWSAAAWSAEAQPSSGPLGETFTMNLKDSERTFVVHNGTSYLLTKPEDFTDHDFLNGKDVMLVAKFQRGQNDRIWIYKPDDLEVDAAPELWSDRVDGDNLYLFGRLAWDNDQGHAVLKVAASAQAPSDTQWINDHLKGVAKDDYEGRLKVAIQVRDQGPIQGNPDWWLQQSDALLTHLITDTAAEAEASKNAALLAKAIGWCIDVQKDPVSAARIASAPWLRTVGGKDADEISLRMRRMGMDLYRSQWHPRAEALSMEYDDRFAALGWRDAEGFYRLGRWADANAESLPQAKDRSYRAYQAGLKADPSHPGIRRELGLELNTGETTVVDSGETRSEYKDPSLDIAVRSPVNWRRGEGALEGIRWEDPSSDTAYISVRFADLDKIAFADEWTQVTAKARALPGFTVIDEAKPDDQATTAHLHYSCTEDNLGRLGSVILQQDATTKLAVIIEGSYVEEEKDRIIKALDDVLAHVLFPASRPVKDPKAAAPAAAPAPAAP